MKRDYRNLTVWQKAMDMVAKIYRLTQRFPKEAVLNGLLNSLPTDNNSLATDNWQLLTPPLQVDFCQITQENCCLMACRECH